MSEHDDDRERLLRRGLKLEAFSITWDVVEGVVAVTAGIISGSTTLMGFGLESTIEVTAAGTLYWRLRKELHGQAPRASVERRALKIVGAAFFLLAAYVAFEAISNLVKQQAPEMSAVGMAMAAAALLVMPFLAYAKRRTGRELDSDALVADSRETIASTYLSVTVLLGLGLNALFSWWWSDSVAALAMIPYLVWSGVRAWKDAREAGEDD
jgi:divalent metal cation (Fe/Co/Zn/Cd) transporter